MRSEAAKSFKFTIKIIGFAVSFISFIAFMSAYGGGYYSAIGVSWLILICGSSVGVFFGFIFSVPRIVLTGDGVNKNEAGTGDRDEDAKPIQRLLQSNSNLERISDWLTTMIVGVALINFNEIIGFFTNFHAFLETSAQLFGPEGARTAGILPVVGSLVLVTGLVLGFLSMYLSTRIFLSSLMLETEKKLAQSELSEIASSAVISKMEELPEKTRAIEAALATRQVYPREAVGTMNKLLYQPGGFEKAIELSGTLVNTPARDLPEFWFYLAAAFGQQYGKLKKTDGKRDETAIRSSKDNALDAARRAVALDPSFREQIRRISNPENYDNDLAQLRNDPEFKEIIRE